MARSFVPNALLSSTAVLDGPVPSHRGRARRMSSRACASVAGCRRTSSRWPRLVERLAVLTGAGIAPLSAWRYAAAEDAPVGGAAGRGGTGFRPRAAGQAGRGGGVRPHGASARRGPRWRPPGGSRRRRAQHSRRRSPVPRRCCAGSPRGHARSRSRSPGPTATSRVVLALPAVGLALGGLLGLRRHRGAGHRAWADLPGGGRHPDRGRRALESAADPCRRATSTRPRDSSFELFAVALAGGASIDRARAAGRRGVRRGGARPARRRRWMPCSASHATAGVPAVGAAAIRGGRAASRRAHARGHGVPPSSRPGCCCRSVCACFRRSCCSGSCRSRWPSSRPP